MTRRSQGKLETTGLSKPELHLNQYCTYNPAQVVPIAFVTGPLLPCMDVRSMWASTGLVTGTSQGNPVKPPPLTCRLRRQHLPTLVILQSPV